MTYEWRIFKYLGGQKYLKEQQEFVKRWLKINSFNESDVDKRMDIYMIYKPLPFEHKQNFGIKFRDVKYDIKSNKYELSKIELKVRENINKRKEEKWTKIISQSLSKKIHFSMINNEDEESDTDYSGSQDQNQFENQQQNNLTQSQQSSQSYQILDNQNSSDLQKNNDDWEYNQAMGLKKEFQQENNQQMYGFQYKYDQSQSQEEIVQNLNQSQKSSSFSIIPSLIDSINSDFEQIQSENENYKNKMSFDNSFTKITEENKKYFGLPLEKSLEIQSAVLKQLSNYISNNEDKYGLKDFYIQAVEAKGNFDLVLVKKARFQDAFSESTFVGLEAITNPFLETQYFLTCNVEGKKEKFNSQEYILKKSFFLNHLGLKDPIYVMGYPESIEHYLQQNIKKAPQV
ncbi:hypothetical protein PPERSA_07169 [Pseudocohnilembus persalinus]|uniref:Uncharacterized protein n=1 Tax=Pseudocohnilembus persalinus TaxID=266149 RepID=A0A0V0QXT0_PSEPJ|nr:hypothetical protein PPERSA_07169 [Pseudocohnilembus persalinus]|eukprot:KRX07006.1 hypothetical protein PPERSA_07169 [Pseudocohnilembus persalinus]